MAGVAQKQNTSEAVLVSLTKEQWLVLEVDRLKDLARKNHTKSTAHEKKASALAQEITRLKEVNSTLEETKRQLQVEKLKRQTFETDNEQLKKAARRHEQHIHEIKRCLEDEITLRLTKQELRPVAERIDDIAKSLSSTTPPGGGVTIVQNKLLDISTAIKKVITKAKEATKCNKNCGTSEVRSRKS